MGLLNEYINRKLSSNDLEQELLKLISQYNKYRETFLVVYAAAIAKPIPAISLNMDDYYVIYDLLRNPKNKTLDFYLETPGGSGEAAEEIVRFTRSKYNSVNFLVSGEAKSAGTIMVLSADDILMTESGSLGPIDAQVRIGRSTVSAYDYMNWIGKRRKDAIRKNKLNPFDATMIAQISPGELNGVNNALNFAEDLVVEWLTKYKFKNWNQTETRKANVSERMKENRAKEIVKDLIDHNKWRSHGRSLKIEDLEEIKLKITKVDSDDKLAEIVYRIQTVIKLLFSSTNIYKIYATESDKIFASAAPVGNPLPVNPQQAEVVNLDITCQKCGKIHKLFAKFVDQEKIDKDFEKQGFKKFPAGNKLICDCKFEIDLTGVRNEVERQVGKKILA